MTADESKALAEYMDTVEETVLALKAELAELKAAQGLSYAGIWQRSAEYSRGQMVTDKGALWFCVRSTADRPGDTDAWQLMAKSNATD